MSIGRDRDVDPFDPESAPLEESALSPGKRTRGDLLPRQRAAAVPGKRTLTESITPDPGFGLPSDLRSTFESSLGTDLSDVRLHTGAEAAAAAGSVGARAFAVGEDISFATGEYDPGSPAGRRLLAHEVAHTAQQRGADALPMYALRVGSHGDPLEHEADRIAVAMLSGMPAPAPSRAEPSVQRDGPEDSAFEYRPAQALDRVWSETATLEGIATGLYGNADLASRLTEVRGTPRSVRFRPELLTAEWRATYYEHRARGRASAEVDGDRVIVLPTSPGGDGPLDAVVVLQPAADSALGDTSLAVDAITGGAPTIDPSTAARPPVTRTDAVTPDTTTVYDAPLDYGESVGNLEDIVEHPDSYRATLDRAEDEAVLVTLSPEGPFADLITSQMTFPVLTPRLGGGTGDFDPADPFGLGSIGRLTPPEPTLGPIFDTPSATIVAPEGDRGMDLAALESALAARPRPEGSADGPLAATDLLPVIVLDPSGEARMTSQDRFTIIRGPGASALIGRLSAPTFLWNGASELQPVTGLDVAAPADGLPDLGRRRHLTGADTGTAITPLATDDYVLSWRSYQVMTVGELRALVRRHTTQRLLHSADDWDGRMLDVDRVGLTDLGTGADVVHGTSYDLEATGRSTVETAGSRTTTDAADDGDTTLSADAIQDRFDLAETLVADLVGQHPPIADLITELLARVRAHRAELARSPRRRSEYASLIENVLRIAAGASQQIRGIGEMIHERQPDLSGSTPEHPLDPSPPNPCIDELEEIRDVYSLALAYSDQVSNSRSLYDAANRRLVLFPLFEIEHRGETAREVTDAALAEEGEDYALAGISVENARYLTRVFSEDASHADYLNLLEALHNARQAALTGDGDAAAESTALAAAIESRMSGRAMILGQLNQALLAFQAEMGTTTRLSRLVPALDSETHEHTASGSDDRLEMLIRRLVGYLERYEACETPEGRLQVLTEVQGLWESEEEYRAFYEDLNSFIDNVDTGVRLAIVVAAGLVSMGVGSAAAGAGMGVMSTIALESLAFTVTDRSLTALARPAASDAAHPTADLGEYAEGWAGDLAINAVGAGMGRGIGRMWRGLGREMPAAMAMGGELATNLVANQALGVGVYAATHGGELPSGAAFTEMGEENVINLVLMTVAGALARPVFSRIQIDAAMRVGEGRAMELLRDQSVSLRTELDGLVARIRERGTPPTAGEQRQLGRLQNETTELHRQAEAVLRAVSERPGWAEELLANPTLAAECEAMATGWRTHIESSRDLAFAARAGLRSPAGGDGAYMLFNRGRADMVQEHYESLGYSVTRGEGSSGRMELTATRSGDRLVLAESREVIGEALADVLAETAPTPGVDHPGVELHNHFNGVPTPDDFVTRLFEGNWESAARDLATRFRRQRLRTEMEMETLRNQLDRMDPRDRPRAEDNIAELEAAMNRDLPALEALEAAHGATESEAAVRRALASSDTAAFDVTYRARGALFDPMSDPTTGLGRDDRPSAEAVAESRRRARIMVRASLERLVNDGVRYAEMQGAIPDGVSEGEFLAMCNELGITIRFLRVISTTEFSMRARDPATSDELSALIADALPPRTGESPDAQIRRLAAELARLPRPVQEAVCRMLRSPSTVGLDIAGPERHMFTRAGMQQFAALYRAMGIVHEMVGGVRVLRPHVGEGYEGSEARPEMSHADLEATAEHNLDAVLRTLREVGYEPGHGVEIRFGHATHATDAQLRAMAELGVVAEVNIGSNLTTGSIYNINEHPVLRMLYHGVSTVFSTDGGGVMDTTMRQEWDGVIAFAARFRGGETRLRVGDREVGYGDLDATHQARFEEAHLRQIVEDLLADRAAHPPAVGPETGLPGSTTGGPARVDDDE